MSRLEDGVGQDLAGDEHEAVAARRRGRRNDNLLGLARVVAAHHEDGGRTAADTLSPPSFTDARSAAVEALARTTTAGNPLSQNQLQAQFRLSRAQAAKVRQSVLAEANGHGTDPGS